METLKDRIVKALDDLLDKEFKRFKWLLQQHGNVEGLQPLTKSVLQNAENEEIVDQIVQNYPGKENLLMATLMRKVNRFDLMGRFENTPTGATTENTLLAQQMRDLKADFEKLNTASSNQQTAQQIRDLNAELERLKTAPNPQTAQQILDLKAEVEKLKTALSNQQTVDASRPAVSPVEVSGPAVSPVEVSGPTVAPVEVSGPIVAPVEASGPAVAPGSTNREDFLKHSSALSLDPNTVNENLILSEDYRKVTYTEQHQPYADHPQRFTYWPNVLSRESLSDPFYFEVEWSGEYVCIAVSYKDINRKEGVLSDFGDTDMSWGLGCDGSVGDECYVFSHNSIDTDLSGPVPSTGRNRVGVFVNQTEGLLYFFHLDGDDDMSLIHTVRTSFTRPLYAGIWAYKATAEVCEIW